MSKRFKKEIARERRHKRLRQQIVGTPERPRLNVFKSIKYIYAQIIDDEAGHTLVAVSTKDLVKDNLIENGINVEAAEALGKALAEKAIANGVTQVVFDRGGYPYHGRVKALADAARQSGLEF